MTDIDARTPAEDATGTADPVAAHPRSTLHRDATDGLAGNTDAVEPVGLPREGDPHGDGARGEPDLVDDAAELTDASSATADHVPGDGSVGSRPPHGDVDVVATAPRGREAAAARADTSDTAPTPTETHNV